MSSSETPPLTEAPGDRDRCHSPVVPVRGWWLTCVAGLVPLSAGIVTLIGLWNAVAHADSPVNTGLGHLGFSYADLASVGEGASAWLELNGSVGGVNVAAAAVALIVVSRFGLREGRRWAWWFLAFCLIWVGLHDAVMATRFFLVTGQPVMVLPYSYVSLMVVGLLRTRRAVFGTPRS